MLPTKVLLRKAAPTCTKPMVKGIDVSHHQGTIDWTAIGDPHRHYSSEAPDESFDFAIVRVSDGTFLDRQFERNWKLVRECGLVRGVYQFFRAGGGRAVLQADLMLERIDKCGGIDTEDLPPVIDIERLNEADPQQVVDDVLAWTEHVSKQLDVLPILYTYPSFWCANLLCCCSHLPLWIAHYRGDNLPGAPQAAERPPLIPIEQWEKWAMWQHSSTGRITGIKPGTDVDLNVFDGDFADFLCFIEQAWKPSPTSEDKTPSPSDERPTPEIEVPAPPLGLIIPSPPADEHVPVTIDVDEPVEWGSCEQPTLPSQKEPTLPVLTNRPGCMGWLAKFLKRG